MKNEIKISGLRRGIKEGEILKIEDLMNQIDLGLFNEEMYNELKTQKNVLSNRDKKYILKVLTNSKLESKENVLKAIICFAIWQPDEAIRQAYQRKGPAVLILS